MSTIADRLKTAIQQSGMSQRELEAKTGIPHSAIQRYASGYTDRIPIGRIEALARVLGTTPDYLLGWKIEQDDWSSAFCSALELELSSVSLTDAYDSGMDLERLHSIAAGEIPISLEEACTIADELGTSLDCMVGLRELDDKAMEFISLFRKLDSTQQNMLIAQMKGLLENFNK